jgi:hypothetical protein
MKNNLVEQPSWAICDATKIQRYLDCPRAYFYEFVLGWRHDAPSIHLEFGSAWHLAMEHLILHGYSDKSIGEAFMLFHDYYRQFFPEILDDANHPKTPAMAFKGLVEYAREYAGEQFTPIYTEIAGTVSLDARRALHFRMDSILETPDGVKSREHKTGSQLSRPWTDQWQLKTQTFVYNHVLYCLFPREIVWGVEINGAIFSKKNIQFTRVPARRSPESMEVGWWNIKQWVDQIEQNFHRLADCSESDPVMYCFPMNTESCTKYFGCQYHDFCMAWSNPLDRVNELPTGYKIEYWNPADHEREAKYVFNLDKEGEGTK